MIDGGQNFFKICLTVLPEDYSPASENEEIDSIDDDTPDDTVSKRNLYSNGGTSGKKCKLTSVQRLILVCVVPKIKETYENVKLLFNMIKINNISFKVVCDFKLLLIINGQQTASAMFPCPYCFVSQNDFKNFQQDFLSESTADEDADDTSELKNLKVSSDLSLIHI